MEVKKETAIFAGGCFWGMEELLRKLPGVIETTVGYTGGKTDAPVYAEIKTGKTGHAEAVKVVFDPSIITYEELLNFFFKIHDPTTLNRQGNDIGTQYRSVIFYMGEEQQNTALEVKTLVDSSGKLDAPVVTEVLPAKEFWNAEEYHQKYLVKYPEGYTCHFVRNFKF